MDGHSTVEGMPVAADAIPIPDLSTATETPVVTAELILAAGPNDGESQQKDTQPQVQDQVPPGTLDFLAKKEGTGHDNQEGGGGSSIQIDGESEDNKHDVSPDLYSCSRSSNECEVTNNTEEPEPPIPRASSELSIPNDPSGIWTHSMIHHKTDAMNDSQPVSAAPNTTLKRDNDNVEPLHIDSDSPMDREAQPSSPAYNGNEQQHSSIGHPQQTRRRWVLIIAVLILIAIVATAVVTMATTKSNRNKNDSEMEQVLLDQQSNPPNEQTDEIISTEPQNSTQASSGFSPSASMSNEADPISVSPTTLPKTNPTTLFTLDPSDHPSSNPTKGPTEEPTQAPTGNPSRSPSVTPTASPTDSPSNQPATAPTKTPTAIPTTRPPTHEPTSAPTSGQPTLGPTTSLPTPLPSQMSSIHPSAHPTTVQPTTSQPTPRPTALSTTVSTPSIPVASTIPETVELFGRSYNVATTRRINRQASLPGTIPTQIGLLTVMTLLDLGPNDLSGTIPTEMGLLTALTRLS